ncbi:tetratricopeptide repeat protein, partial [Kaarinaea lacus]
MNFSRKILFFLTVMSLASSAYAAGDYILENKFKRELPKAEQGDVKAQYAVGEMYEKGKGAVRDVNKAFDWYMKAANQNDKKAAYKVGLFYYQGRGVEVNYEQA